MQTIFKEGDWCFCEFELKQIKEIRNGNIVSVEDGWFSCYSSDLNDRCFPLSLQGKVISESYYKYKEDSRALYHKNTSLYFPQINRWFVGEWAVAMQNQSPENTEKLKECFQRAKDMVSFLEILGFRMRELSFWDCGHFGILLNDKILTGIAARFVNVVNFRPD